MLPEAHVVRVLNDVENVLYLASVITLSPLLILLLLLLVAPVSALAWNNDVVRKKLNRLNIIIFKITKYLYRPLSVDKSGDIPRFIIFGYITPIYYTYHLLSFALLIAVYCLHQFWEVTFLSSQQMVDCDEDQIARSTQNSTECIVLSLRTIQASSSVVALVAAIIFVHLFVLEIFLKFSGGKESFRNLANKKNNYFRLVRIIFTIIVQFFFIVVGRVVYIVYFVAADYGKGTRINLFDRHGWFTISLLIDDISFVMLTPWFLFEKVKKKKKKNTELETEMKEDLEIETALVNAEAAVEETV